MGVLRFLCKIYEMCHVVGDGVCVLARKKDLVQSDVAVGAVVT